MNSYDVPPYKAFVSVDAKDSMASFEKIQINDIIYYGYWQTGYYVKHYNRETAPVGDYLHDEDVEHWLYYSSFADWNMPRSLERVKIIPETLCRYTEIRDNEGIPIYEHDYIQLNKEVKEIFLIEDGYIHYTNGCFTIGLNAFVRYTLQAIVDYSGILRGKVISNAFEPDRR